MIGCGRRSRGLGYDVAVCRSRMKLLAYWRKSLYMLRRAVCLDDIDCSATAANTEGR